MVNSRVGGPRPGGVQLSGNDDHAADDLDHAADDHDADDLDHHDDDDLDLDHHDHAGDDLDDHDAHDDPDHHDHAADDLDDLDDHDDVGVAGAGRGYRRLRRCGRRVGQRQHAHQR